MTNRSQVEGVERHWSLSHFWGGLIQNSWSSLVGTLLVTVAFFGATFKFVNPSLMSRLRWVRSDDDQYGALTTRALSVSSRREPDEFSLVLLTASSVRDAISDSVLLQREVEVGLGDRPVGFVNLSSGALTFWEMLSVADVVAEHLRGVVLIEVAPAKFCRGDGELKRITQTHRLGLQSTLLREEHLAAEVDAPRSTGIYAIDNREFCLARRYRLLSGVFHGVSKPSMRLVNAETHGGNPRVWEDSVKMKRKFLAHYFEEVDRNTDLLIEIIKCFQDRSDVEIVLIESPYNPMTQQLVYSDPAYGIILSEYQQRIAEVANHSGVQYWDILRTANLSSADFIDDYHLADLAARSRFTKELGRRLSEWVGQRFVTDDGATGSFYSLSMNE